MTTPDLLCNICTTGYDLSRHIPVNMPNCEHNLCSCCALTLLKNSNSSQIQCPFDPEHIASFDTRLEEEELFAKNLGLMTLLQGRENFKEKQSSTGASSPHDNQESTGGENQSEALMNLMETFDQLENQVRNEMTNKEMGILNKKIAKLKETSKKHRELNFKLLKSMKKKKGDLSSLTRDIKLLYSKFDQFSSGYEELWSFSEEKQKKIEILTRKVDQLSDQLSVSRALHEESCKEAEELREEIHQKREKQGGVAKYVMNLEDEKKDLLERMEDVQAENLRLVEYLELKDAEKTNIKEELVKEVQRQERSKEKIQRERDEVSMNRDGFSMLAQKKNMEVEKLRDKVEEKDEEIMKLKEKIEDLEEDKEIYFELYNKRNEDRRGKCMIF